MFYISNLFVCPNPPVSTDSVFPLCALLRPSRCFTKLLQCLEQCLSNSRKQRGQYRSLIGVMFTANRPRAPLRTRYKSSLSRWCPRFKVTRRSRIERSDTCSRRFIACFCGPRNGFELSLESVIIRATTIRSFVVVGETVRETFANRLVISEVQQS
jgi:hypothetical protein